MHKLASSGPMATLASSVPTMLYYKSSQSTWLPDFGTSNHMTDEFPTFISQKNFNQLICLYC